MVVQWCYINWRKLFYIVKFVSPFWEHALSRTHCNRVFICTHAEILHGCLVCISSCHACCMWIWLMGAQLSKKNWQKTFCGSILYRHLPSFFVLRVHANHAHTHTHTRTWTEGVRWKSSIYPLHACLNAVRICLHIYIYIRSCHLLAACQKIRNDVSVPAATVHDK